MGIDCDLCETNFLWGGKGICDEGNNTCICPEGFSGNDDWVATQTCHVNDSAAVNFHRVLLPFTVNATIICFGTLIQLLRKWHVTGFRSSSAKQENQDHISVSHQTSLKATPSSTVASSQNSEINAATPIVENTRPSKVKSRRDTASTQRMQKIKDMTIIIVLIWTIGAAISVYYQVTFIRSQESHASLKEHRAGLSIVLMLTVISGWAGAVMMLFTWYLTLPLNTIEKYGHLLKYDPILVKHPKLMLYIVYGMMFLGFALPFLIFVVLPLILQEDEYMKTPAHVFAYVSFTYVLGFTILVYFLSRNLLYLFRSGRDAFKHRDRSNDEGLKRTIARIETTIETIVAFRSFSLQMAFTSLFFHIFWMVGRGFYQYIFFSIAFGLHYVTLNVWPLIILKRTNGGLTPIAQITDTNTS